MNENIRKVVPYVPGEQPKRKGIIKLNTNECPYPPSPRVKRALSGIDYERLRLYPDPAASDLVDNWAKRCGLNKDQVFVGVGSDDVLSMCFLTFFAGKRPITFPDITYSFYDVWCDVYRIPYEVKPLKDDFTIDIKDYTKGDFGGVVIANPNAPTGVALPLSDIEKIVKANKNCVVIVDEAYVDFGAESAVGLIEKYDNLIVVQTFSKSRAMAGMRIGFAMGCPTLIKYLNDVKYSVNSYTMNYPSIVAGTAAIKDENYFKKIVSKVMSTRDRIETELAELGFSFNKSSANFIFARHERIPGAEIFERLKKRKIYVRHWDKERISDYLRITIGTDDEMDRLIDALKEIIGLKE
ncbi:MAG: histidinol-phosphate transaminase [Lachnospiraceae bacterium]|nr:histidinol-phosphate transaminase [Lachnospiraceae bacterium]